MEPLSNHIRGESTFADYGVERLSRVCHAVGLSDIARDATGTFRRLLEPWGERTIGAAPAWPSDIVDDHTPFEISVTVGGRRSEVRVLVEAQGDAPTLRSQREAGRALSKRMERELGANLERLRLVEDLFLPEDPKGVFSSWHAVSFRSDRELDLKVYLNLHARGRALAPALAEEALVRLGFDRAWPALSQVAARRGFVDDELLYFSLDLSAQQSARVKVYFRHHRATADDLERALAIAPLHNPGEVAAMCRALGGDGPYVSRAPVSCFSYMAGRAERPSEATIYFPITGYVTDDGEAKSRISAYLAGLGVPTAQYEAAIDAFTSRPLESGVGMQSYVSLRRDHGVPRLTVYFGPEAYSTQPPRTRVPPVRPAPQAPSVEQLVRRHEAEPLTDHPFFRRLRREPADLDRLCTLATNLQLGLVDDLPRVLSGVAARVDDDRLRCVLARQLDDALGDGDWSRAQKTLFAELVQAIEAHRATVDEASRLAPGHALRVALESWCASADPYEGVGMALLLPTFGAQLRRFLKDEVGRQGSIDPATVTWLTLPDGRSDDSTALDALLPEGAPRDAAARGADGLAASMRACFDAMYEVCFGRGR